MAANTGAHIRTCTSKTDSELYYLDTEEQWCTAAVDTTPESGFFGTKQFLDFRWDMMEYKAVQVYMYVQ